MGDETRIRIKYRGWQFELRTELPWDQVMDRCQRDFGGANWIGGPEIKEGPSASGGQTTGRGGKKVGLVGRR